MTWPNPTDEELKESSFIRYSWDTERRRKSVHADGYKGVDRLPPALTKVFSDVQLRSGHAIDAKAYFMDPEMPWFLKQSEAPFYALYDASDEENMDYLRHHEKWGPGPDPAEFHFSHPSKGSIKVINRSVQGRPWPKDFGSHKFERHAHEGHSDIISF